MSRGPALPLDDRGQIPGQLSASDQDVDGRRVGGRVSVTPDKPTDQWAPELMAVGVDTWKLVWRVVGWEACEGLSRGFAGRSVLTGKVAGHKVGWDARHQLLWAEGHPAEALGEPGALCPPARLLAAREAVAGAMWSDGVAVPSGLAPRVGTIEMPTRALVDRAAVAGYGGFLGVGRLDVSADLRFDAALGVRVLDVAAAAWRLPGSRLDVQERRGDQGHTVWLTGTMGHVARFYDKGLERRGRGGGDHARGEWLRVESQDRWDGTDRRPVEELSPTRVRRLLARRLEPWRHARQVEVVDVAGLCERITEAVAAGKLTPNAGDRAIAYGACEASGCWGHWSAESRRRVRRDLERLGLRVQGIAGRRVADLRAVRDTAVESKLWENDA